MENPSIRKKRRIVQPDWLSLMVLNCHTLTRKRYNQKLERKESMATGGAWYSYWLSLRLLPLLHCGADQLTIHCLQLTILPCLPLRQRIYCLFTFYRSVSMTYCVPPVSVDVRSIPYSMLDILDRMSNCPYFQFITFDSIRQHAMTFISRQSMSTQNAIPWHRFSHRRSTNQW